MKLQAHPPERRRRGVTLAAHGCCCCCCCCLHSLGGLIGGAVASTKAATPEARRTVRAYWWLFLASTATGVAGLAVQNRHEIVVALVLGAIGLPLAQLMASFLIFLAGMIWPMDLRTLWRITWKSFLWAAVGALVMAVPLVMMSY